MLTVARRMLRGAPENLTEQETAIWVHALIAARVDPADITPALTRYMVSHKWFPAPAEIIESARGIESERWAEIRAQRQREEELQRRAEREAEAERLALMSPEQIETERREREERIAAVRARLIAAGILDDPNKREPVLDIEAQIATLKKLGDSEFI